VRRPSPRHRRLQNFETQFHLLDLAIDLLLCIPELHALELRDLQLQVLDLKRKVGEYLLDRRYSVAQTREIAFALTYRRPSRNRESLQGLDIVRKGSVAGCYWGKSPRSHCAMPDACANGQQLECLTVVDEYTHECLAIDASGSIRSVRVIGGVEPADQCS